MDLGTLLMPELQGLAQEALKLVTGLSVGAARAIGIMIVLPVFTRAQFGGVLRGTLAIALALPHVVQTADALAAIDGNGRIIQLSLITLKELFVGFMVGCLLSVPFWAIQAVGELIDMQRGITSEVAPIDPSSPFPSSAVGFFLGLAAVTLFVAAGGLETTVDTLYRSYGIWPVTTLIPAIDPARAAEMFKLLDHIVRFGVVVGGPVIIFLLLIDIAVMLIGRFAPQFKPFDLAPMIKNIGFALFMLVYAAFLFDYLGAELASTRGVIDTLREVIK